MTDRWSSLFGGGEWDQRAAAGLVFARPTTPIAAPHDLQKRSLDPFG